MGRRVAPAKGEVVEMVNEYEELVEATEDRPAVQVAVSQDPDDWLEALERRPKRSVSEMVREALTGSPDEEEKPDEH